MSRVAGFNRWNSSTWSCVKREPTSLAGSSECISIREVIRSTSALMGIQTTLETAHLRLIQFSPTHLVALFESLEQFNAAFGIRADASLREAYTSSEIPEAWREMVRNSTEANFWLHGFAAVHRADNLVIGAIGFKGPPDDSGTVEISYGIAPAYQGRGYATECAAALTEFAYNQEGVKLVIAHTLPQSNASTRVLTKCGYKHTGEVTDPEDGLVWRWEKA
jgi:[ribosomal protein S5]-alanine N-acetyltransferase